MVLLIREGWEDGKTLWKISNSQSCPKKTQNCPAKVNANYERVVQNQNPTARNTWEINWFFLKISICVDKMLFVLKMLKTRWFFQKRMKVCAENCPIFCKKYFAECDILCFRTCNYQLYCKNSSLFFRSYVHYFQAAFTPVLYLSKPELSSHLQHPFCLTARIVRHAVTWPQRLWISPRLLRDTLLLLERPSSDMPPNSAPRRAPWLQRLPPFATPKCRKQIRYFSFFFLFALNSLQSSALSQPHLSVLLFLNSAVWGRLAHQYTIRGGG